MNSVGRSLIPSSSVIYIPAGQAGEYAELACNPYRGCGHACHYCYVPLITKQDRKEFDAGPVERKNFLIRLRHDAKVLRTRGINGQVMLSFTTDVYNPFDTSLTRPTLEILIEHGFDFCVLTKGGARALVDIDLYRPTHDAFACTLTSLDDRFSKKWEQRAALPGDRIKTLRAFYDAGIFTWVSLEPTLDVEASLEIVKATYHFVNLYKVGRANYLKEITRITDWRDYTLRMIDLLNRTGARHYIKRDLQSFLPPDYYNPLRVQQFVV